LMQIGVSDPGPWRRWEWTLVADFLDVLDGNDPRRAGRGGCVEDEKVRPRFLEMETHAIRVDDLDLPHLVFEHLGRRSAVTIERELHVVGGQEVAVVEVNTLPQHELIGQSVGRYGPALREARRHRLAWHRLHEGVMKAIEDPERRDDPRGVGRVEPRRGEREVESQGQLSFGRSLGWRGHAREEHDERERSSQTDTTLHGGPPLARPPRPSFHEILESGAATRPTARTTASPITAWAPRWRKLAGV